MPDSSGRLDLTEIMTRLAGLLFSEETLQSSLELTTRLAHETISGSWGAGVTMIRDGKKYTAAYTDTLVERADAIQYELSEGPCLSAWERNEPIRVDDVAADKRWPQWSPQAAALGLRSCISAPLLVHQGPSGAMKVYSSNPQEFDDRDLELLSLFAEQAGIVLANVEGYWQAQAMSDQLKEALLSRDVIGQAKGILMEREGLDDEAAFAMLRQASQTQNIKLRDIAQSVVETTRGRSRGNSPVRIRRGQHSGP